VGGGGGGEIFKNNGGKRKEEEKGGKGGGGGGGGVANFEDIWTEMSEAFALVFKREPPCISWVFHSTDFCDIWYLGTSIKSV